MSLAAPVLADAAGWCDDAILRAVDEERGRFVEERPDDRRDFPGEARFQQSRVHERDPAIAGGRCDRERGVTHPQRRVASLVEVRVRASEPIDQEVAESSFGSGQLGDGIHRREEVIAGDATIEGVYQLSQPRFTDGVEDSGWVGRTGF